MASPRHQIDWEKAEGQYRAGIMSLREIASEHGVSEGAIRKRAKRDGWERNLTARIAEKAEALVRKAEVRSEVRAEDEKAIVEANANLQAGAILNQRKDVGRARGVVQKLFAELEAQLDNLDSFESLGELMEDPEGNQDKLNDLYRKVMALPSRTDTAKKLAESLRILVELERKVLRIKDDDPSDEPGKERHNIEVRFVG